MSDISSFQSPGLGYAASEEYFKKHQLQKLFEDLTAYLIFTHPDDPIRALYNKLGMLIETGNLEPPPKPKTPPPKPNAAISDVAVSNVWKGVLTEDASLRDFQIEITNVGVGSFLEITNIPFDSSIGDKTSKLVPLITHSHTSSEFFHFDRVIQSPSRIGCASTFLYGIESEKVTSSYLDKFPEKVEKVSVNAPKEGALFVEGSAKRGDVQVQFSGLVQGDIVSFSELHTDPGMTDSAPTWYRHYSGTVEAQAEAGADDNVFVFKGKWWEEEDGRPGLGPYDSSNAVVSDTFELKKVTAEVESEGLEMKVNVKVQEGPILIKTLTITVKNQGSASVEDIKREIEETENIARAQQKLTLRGRLLKDGSLLSSLGIHDGSQLFLTTKTVSQLEIKGLPK